MVLGVWGLVSVARATRLVEPAETPPGQELVPLLDFLRANIPTTASYLYVLPGEFGTDTGTGPRLRYELTRAATTTSASPWTSRAIRQLMQHDELRFIVVPDASQYARHVVAAPAARLAATGRLRRQPLPAGSRVLSAMDLLGLGALASGRGRVAGARAG